MNNNEPLYTSISEYYDLIFNLSNNEKNFYDSFDINASDKVLEIGCGTGQLIDYLNSYSKDVMGIDLDCGMINFAKDKYPYINFFELNMKDIDLFFKSDKFDYIFCMGNTMVHLENTSDIEMFLKKVKSILNKNGKFIFQILNYDKIINQNIKELPLIENDKIAFQRKYHFINGGKIIFETVLTIKKNNIIIENKTQLYPLKSGEISEILKNIGFKDFIFYGNFIKDILNNDNSDLLIGVCE